MIQQVKQTEGESTRLTVSQRETAIAKGDRQALCVPGAMCEAYHYEKPSAFSRGMEIDLGMDNIG